MAAGPELILAGLAFPAAAIGTAELIQKYGEHLTSQVRSYKKAPQTVKDFEVLGVNLHAGAFSILIADACEACTDIRTPPSSKEGLNGYFDQLARKLKDSEALLDHVVNKDGSIKGVGWFLKNRERELRECLSDLDKIQQLIDCQLGLLRRNRERKITDNHLEPQKFKEIAENQEPDMIRDTTLRLGRAKMKVGQEMRTVSVIIEERLSLGEDITVLKADTSELAHSLSDPETQPGILKCLGYRTMPLDLVFEVPSKTNPQAPQTLWRLLSDEKSTSEGLSLAKYAGGHSLKSRFALSLQLAKAVLSVHTKKLIHKNIRSNSVLIFKSLTGDTTEIGDPYLCDWRIVHKIDALSITDPNTKWQEDVYRHPERQNFLNLPNHNMGHDIYSLGVCLLEIGLWEPLVLEKSTGKDPTQLETVLSDTFCHTALELGFMNESEVGSAERTLEPKQVYITLETLAAQFLPSRMGPIFAGLVACCLNCLDATKPNVFGDVQDFMDPDVTGSKFIKLIIEPLQNLRV